MSMTVLYRKSDKLVVGWIPASLSATDEITNNIVTSGLGGVASDYASSAYSGDVLPTDHEFVIETDLTVTTQERTEITQRKIDRDSAVTKLKAATWSPLTDAELKAVFEIGTS